MTAMPDDAILLLEDGRVIDCNAEAERMFRLARGQLLHLMPHDLSPQMQPDGRRSSEEVLDRMRRAAAGESQTFEWQHRRADGGLVDAEVSLSKVDFGGRPMLLAVVRDITERRKAEEASGETEQMFRAIVENSHAGIFTIDDAFRITYANDMTGQMLARSNEEIIGHDFREMLDEESVEIVADHYLRRRMGEDVPSRYEFNIVRKDGSKRRVEISSSIFRTTSGSLRTVGQVLDITERKQAESELREAIRAREQAAAAERNRLARDLHDAVSQTLFSASLIADVLPQLWERNEAEGRKRLEEVRQLTKGALAEMRTLLVELRPAALLEAKLGQLLVQLGESISSRARVPVTVSVRSEYPLPADVKVALYRVAQEALNNVAKHSEATSASVSLVYEAKKVTLTVADDGRGFSRKAIPPDSLGLGIMRERTRQVGASLSVRSQTGKGTTVRMVWRDPGNSANSGGVDK